MFLEFQNVPSHVKKQIYIPLTQNKIASRFFLLFRMHTQVITYFSGSLTIQFHHFVIK